jgi:mannose-6-phosphate isomerase-like protein (cupin superfamily)
LVLEGTGTLAARGERFPLEAETIARLPVGWGCEIRVPHGESLHFVLIRKRLEPPDRAELETHAANNSGAYVRRFRDCPRYGESIKSERTVSRTLLPENVVPRMAAGSVEAVGPDEVGAHRHPMLDQLWLGLRGHDVTVHADGASVRMRENELLHIPLGSTHGASVGAGNRMHYVWLDFFESVEAQQWLRQHNPLPAAPQDGAEL